MAGRAFEVTLENVAQVHDYLHRLLDDDARATAALGPIDSRSALQHFPLEPNPAALETWIDTYLSSAGRKNMLAALRQRRQKDRTRTVRVDAVTYQKLESLASRRNTDPEGLIKSLVRAGGALTA